LRPRHCTRSHSWRCPGETVRDSLLRLLDEPDFRGHAEQLRDEMLAMPVPNDIVTRLEELTTGRQSHARPVRH
jgi:hypothetical protein